MTNNSVELSDIRLESRDKSSTFGNKENFLVVLVMILGVFVAILNETFLNVALSKIMADTGISPSIAQWLTTRFIEKIGGIHGDLTLQIQAMMAGMKSAFLLAFGLVAFAWVISFFLKRSVPQEQKK